MKDVCQKHVSSPPATSSAGGAGLGRRQQAYLDGGHLRVSSPAEPLKLQGVVAEAHGPAGWRGPFLQLKFQVVKIREIMVPGRSAEEKEHRYLVIWKENQRSLEPFEVLDVSDGPFCTPPLRAGGQLCRACGSSPEGQVPIPVVAEATSPEAANERPGTLRCWQLTERRWGRVCSDGSDRLRSAPRRMAPGTRQRRSGSLWAGSACLHSPRANELLVPNQRRAPAGGEAGATIFIPLYPFSYWPRPHLDQLLFHLSAELFPDGCGSNEVCKPSRPGAAALPPAAASLPLPSPSGTVWGQPTAAGSPPSSLPMGTMESSQPHVHLLLAGGRWGAATRTRARVQHTSF